MRIRTNSVTFLATLLAIGWVMTGPAGASGRRRRASTSRMGEKDRSAMDDLLNWKSSGLLTKMAWAQGVPRLPAGARGAPATQEDNDEIRGLEIPVRTRPPFIRGRAEPAQIKRTTEQLESLLKTVQPEVSDLSKGQLPKDLIPNLKRIEKLSKELRRQISR